MSEPPCLAFALKREAKPFLRRLRRVRIDPSAPWTGDGWTGTTPGGRPVRVLLCGVGRSSVEEMLKKWLAGGRRPPLLVCAGFAGGLTPDLGIASVIRPAQLIDDQTGRTWPASGIAGAAGRLVMHVFMIGRPADKEALGRKWQATAVDMESAEFARICLEHAIPFGCVRVISDRMRDRLPTELLGLVESHRRREISTTRLVRSLIGRPSFAFELWRLARDTRRAARVLAEELIRVVDTESPPVATGGL